ncbi:MAG: type II toxin-antitoxin system RelE/ParE family toxin [Gemmatimonadaceae bacterium]|nr:type II toxin-antitoxin system RelE/ParE family toxin [Gemmatimonadaceae bacterium]
MTAFDLPDPKPVEWIGSARDDLREMPEAVQDNFGYALYQAQLGLHHASAKRLRGEFGGLIELVENFDGETYRAVYTVKLAGVVYVLHVFQKKSKRGIATPKHELALIRRRWKETKWHHATHYQHDHERQED